MDAGFTLIVKFGERELAKKCSARYNRSELLSFLVAKWVGLSEADIFLSYDLLGAGELDLADEDDMETMFRLMDELQNRRVLIYVRRLSIVDKNVVTESGSEKEIVQCSRDVDDVIQEDRVVVVPNGQRLRSEEWRHLIAGPGQRFSGGVVEFRRALIKYSVQVGFEFKFLKNDPARVTAVCKTRGETECPWRIHAVIDMADSSFRISSYDRNHTCGLSFGKVTRKRLNYHIITEIIVEDIRAMPSLTPVQVVAMVKKNYGIDISYCVAWKAMDRGRSLVFGDHTASFSLLDGYLGELERANPGSHVHLDVAADNKFRMCFFAFGACVMGFKHCRPMLMVDGTFLKGRHKGVLLSAVAKDGDEGEQCLHL